VQGYRITAMPDANSAFMPLAKTVQRASGAWLDNYARWPVAWLIPGGAFAGALGAAIFSARRHTLLAFLCSGIAVGGVILTGGAAMFPFIMPSSLAPGSSLTAWDAVSSHKTLSVMFWVVVIMLPIISLYTAWVYRVVRGKITPQYIRDNEHNAY
jgi:cytochrome d ubiquinol oxidase subunit II